MNAARLSDGLLGAGQTIKLLRFVESCPNGVRIEQLLLDFAALSPTSKSKIINTIKVLDRLDFVNLVFNAGSGTVTTETLGEDLFASIRNSTAQSFAKLISASSLESCIVADAGGSMLELDSFLLPGVVDGFRFWLIEFDIAVRTALGDRFWLVQPDVTNEFLSCVSLKNSQRHSKRIKLSTLKAQLDRNEQLGREAEDWVLKMERQRLSKHLLVEQIKKISDDDVSAGFDLLSFSDVKVLTYDRFIEVKSYSSQPHFFWSRNEVDKSKELSEHYVLILVDREKMNDTNYRPTEIADPYRALFLTDENGWTFEPNSYEFCKD